MNLQRGIHVRFPYYYSVLLYFIFNKYEGNLCRQFLGSSISSSTGKYLRIPRRSPTCRLRTGRMRRAWRMNWQVHISKTFGKQQNTLLITKSRDILMTNRKVLRIILTCAKKNILRIFAKNILNIVE